MGASRTYRPLFSLVIVPKIRYISLLMRRRNVSSSTLENSPLEIPAQNVSFCARLIYYIITVFEHVHRHTHTHTGNSYGKTCTTVSGDDKIKNKIKKKKAIKYPGRKKFRTVTNVFIMQRNLFSSSLYRGISLMIPVLHSHR